MDDITVVIPARGEEKTLPVTLPLVFNAARHVGASVEIIVVIPPDSPFRSAPPEVGGTVRWAITYQPGKFEALRTGVALASNESLLVLDADVLPAGSAFAELAAQLRDHDVVAGRIVATNRSGGPDFLRSWFDVSCAAWHEVRSGHPELRWALPGAMYAMSRSFFPAGGLAVPVLDDASIGIHAEQAGARIGYAADAHVEVMAPGSYLAWLRQKLRTRRGWVEMSAVYPERAHALRHAMSHYVAAVERHRPVMQAHDLLITRLAERAYRNQGPLIGSWRPERSAWRLNAGITQHPVPPDRGFPSPSGPVQQANRE